MPTEGSAGAAAVVAGIIYVAGDRFGAGFDPMPVPVHGVTGAAFLNGLIYLPGGGVAQGGSSGSTIHQVYRPRMNCRSRGAWRADFMMMSENSDSL